MKKVLSFFISMICISQLVCSNINWSFPPETLSTSGINASDPHVAMDPNGNAVAVWIENGFLKSKSKLVGSDWGAVSIVSSVGATLPSVGVDSSGNATAVWMLGSIVQAATKNFNGSWSAPVALSNTNAASPSLAVNAAGNAVAAWARNGNIEISIMTIGGSWQAHRTIMNPGGNATLPKVAIGGTGSNTTGFVVWHSAASPVFTVYASSSPITTASWSSPAAISNGSSNAGYARVAADGNGNATAVWFSFHQTGSFFSSVIVEAATKPASGSWSSSVFLSEPGIRDPSTLLAKIAYDGTGNAIALWSMSFDDSTFSIQSSTLPVYGNWTQPISLIDDNLYSFQADRSVSSFGDALALYLFYNGVALQIQSSELDITGFMNSNWSVPLTISAGMQNGSPSVAATLTGNAVNSAAVWMSSNGLVNSVVAATGTKSLVLPPSNLAVTQSSNNFGVFTEYFNTLSWNASTDPNAVGYLIYRNGVFLAQVPANVLQIIDDNQVQNGSVTYGVASIDSLQSHSPSVTISFP
jgi:hypothetical protein